MCAEHSVRDTFDRLASEYDELKLRVIPGYRQVQDLALRYANANSSERASLASGGLFLYADITVAADPALERAFQEGWRTFMLGAGLDAERIPYVLADHRDNDLAESSSTQLSYLRTAGFTPAEIIWCWEKFAVFYGAKPNLGKPADLHATSGGLGDSLP